MLDDPIKQEQKHRYLHVYYTYPNIYLDKECRCYPKAMLSDIVTSNQFTNFTCIVVCIESPQLLIPNCPKVGIKYAWKSCEISPLEMQEKVISPEETIVWNQKSLSLSRVTSCNFYPCTYTDVQLVNCRQGFMGNKLFCSLFPIGCV